MSRRPLRQMVATLREPRAVSLPEACARLGLSIRTGNRLVAEGRFPIPELPQLGVKRHRYSSAVIDEYLLTASTRGW
jgi:predicted DNA-binding transcriptional regulator AlpA